MLHAWGIGYAWSHMTSWQPIVVQASGVARGQCHVLLAEPLGNYFAIRAGHQADL